MAERVVASCAGKIALFSKVFGLNPSTHPLTLHQAIKTCSGSMPSLFAIPSVTLAMGPLGSDLNGHRAV